MPDTSPLVRKAETEALATFDRRVHMFANRFQNRNQAGGATNSGPTADQHGQYMAEYEYLREHYCANLHTCYPMFAMHHMSPELRDGTNWGNFHCPCDRVCWSWRMHDVVLIPPSFPKNLWIKDRPWNPDWCGFTSADNRREQGYKTIELLLGHLEKVAGPMHHAAATYLRHVYYTKPQRMDPGTLVFDADSGANLIKVEENGETMLAPCSENDLMAAAMASAQRKRPDPPGNPWASITPLLVSWPGRQESDDDEDGDEDKKMAAKKGKKE